MTRIRPTRTSDEILQAVYDRGGNVAQAAADLGITHSYMRKHINVLRLQDDIDRIRQRWVNRFRLVGGNEGMTMARPRNTLTLLADNNPEKAKKKIVQAMRDGEYEYAFAAAALDISERQLRILCQRLKITDDLSEIRLREKADRRGRPVKEPPPLKILKKAIENAGRNFTAMARHFNVSPPTVARWVRDLGL